MRASRPPTSSATAVGSASSETQQRVALALPQLLPAPVLVSRLSLDMSYATALQTASPVAVCHTLLPFTPPEHERPEPVPSSMFTRTAAALTDWKAVESYYSSRSVAFSEELFQFHHRTGVVVDGAVPAGDSKCAQQLFVLTVKPFALVAYNTAQQATSASARVAFRSIPLLPTLVKQLVHDDLRPRPVLTAVPHSNLLAVVEPHFSGTIPTPNPHYLSVISFWFGSDFAQH
jgi:hypothetical protein